MGFQNSNKFLALRSLIFFVRMLGVRPFLYICHTVGFLHSRTVPVAHPSVSLVAGYLVYVSKNNSLNQSVPKSPKWEAFFVVRYKSSYNLTLRFALFESQRRQNTTEVSLRLSLEGGKMRARERSAGGSKRHER